MTENQKMKLERPFDPKLIKKRKGPGCKELSYVPVGEYIRRLNECFGSGWSFEITAREQFESQIIVEGRLIADGVIKAGIGGAELRRGRDGDLMSLGDAFKSASSDCLKRCCRLWSIGLALYDEDDESGVASNSNAAFPTSENKREPATERGRVSKAQLSKLAELVVELGSDWQSFRKWVKSERQISVEYADKRLASELIEDLIGRLRRKRSLNGSGPHNALNGGQP